jgi:hypothetical protein
MVEGTETHLITYLLIGWERIGVCEGVFANMAMISDLYGEHWGGSQVAVVGRLG